MATAIIFTEQNGSEIFLDDNLEPTISNRKEWAFKSFILFDEAVNGLTAGGIEVIIDSEPGDHFRYEVEIDNLKGTESNSYLYSFDILIRRTDQAGSLSSSHDSSIITITLMADAVTDGNIETSQDITVVYLYNLSQSRYTSSYLQWELVNDDLGSSGSWDFKKRGEYLYIGQEHRTDISAYDEQGVSVPSQDIDPSFSVSAFEFLGDYLLLSSSVQQSGTVYIVDKNTLTEVYRAGIWSRPVCFLMPGGKIFSFGSLLDSPIDFDGLFSELNTSVSRSDLNPVSVELKGQNIRASLYSSSSLTELDYNGDKIYCVRSGYIVPTDTEFNVQNDEIYPILGDIISGDLTADDKNIWLLTNTGNQSRKELWKLPISAMSKPKRRQLIYPIFVNEGDSIDVTKYITGAERLAWDIEYEPPDYLTLNGMDIDIASNAVTSETAVEVKLKAFNRRGFTDDNNFKFYIVIRQNTAPVVEIVQNISMPPNSSFDVSQLVDAADSYTSLSRPSGSTFSGSLLSIGTVGGNVRIRATKDGLNSTIQFNVDVIRRPTAADYSDIFRYRLEIAGIDVTDDLQQDPYPEISNTLDPVNVNEYIVNNATLKLDYRNGYYNYDTPDNFWSANNLNQNGYLEPVKLYVESLVNGIWISNLLFVGLILETIESINDDLITVNCVDSSYILKSAQSKGRGIQKYAESFEGSQESYEGVYDIEEYILPISEGSAEAWAGTDKLDVKTTRNPSEGVNIDNSAYVSRSQILTQGGRLDSVPFLKFRTGNRYKDTTFSVKELSKVGKIFNPDNQIIKPELGYDFIQNKGNIQFNTQNTRITHIPQDWVYDSSNEKVYILLMNPTIGYKDILVEHDIESDRQTIIKEFDDDITCTQFSTSDGNTFYIMTTTSIELDRSLFPVPKDNPEVVNRYDAALLAETKIVRYVKSTDTTSDFVDSNDEQRPQVGMHYHVGFANELRSFNYEGIVPENRSSFEVINNQLYYRYWREEGFGVARVSSAGTVTELTRRTSFGYNNHLNFAFDVDSSRNTYMVYFESTVTGSTIKVRRITNGGTESELYTETRTLTELTDLSDDGGWVSGIYEVLHDNGDLYIIAGIGHTEIYYDASDVELKTRSERKGAGCVLYKLDLSDTASGLQVIDKYDFIQSGIRSLTVHKNAIHYIESPSVSYKYAEFNPDLTEDDLDTNINQDLGKLKRLDSSDEVEDLGNLWYSTLPYKSTNMPMLIIDDELHCIMSFGDNSGILTSESESSRNDNFQWIKYGNKIDYIISGIASGNAYDSLVDIAKKTNSLFLFKQNRISLVDKDPYRALLNGAITTTSVSLNYDNTNKGWVNLPSAGYILIDNEILSYSGKTGSSLASLKRGINGSPIESHSNNSDVLYLDNVIEPNSYLTSSFRLDTNRFFNVVQESNLILEKRDLNSIADFDKIFTLDLGLSRHDTAWIDYMYQKYLDELKELRSFVNVVLKPSFYINLGDIISYYYDNQILKPFRVSTVNYKRDRTEIQGRTV